MINKCLFCDQNLESARVEPDTLQIHCSCSRCGEIHLERRCCDTFNAEGFFLVKEQPRIPLSIKQTPWFRTRTPWSWAPYSSCPAPATDLINWQPPCQEAWEGLWEWLRRSLSCCILAGYYPWPMDRYWRLSLRLPSTIVTGSNAEPLVVVAAEFATQQGVDVGQLASIVQVPETDSLLLQTPLSFWGYEPGWD